MGDILGLGFKDALVLTLLTSFGMIVVFKALDR